MVYTHMASLRIECVASVTRGAEVCVVLFTSLTGRRCATLAYTYILSTFAQIIKAVPDGALDPVNNLF